jgi:hypothetical protein
MIYFFYVEMGCAFPTRTAKNFLTMHQQCRRPRKSPRVYRNTESKDTLGMSWSRTPMVYVLAKYHCRGHRSQKGCTFFRRAHYIDRLLAERSRIRQFRSLVLAFTDSFP